MAGERCMSDPERYTSRAIFREDELYYDLGYRFSTINGRKPKKAFAKDYSLWLLVFTFIIQTITSISQFYTILSLLILVAYRYMQNGTDRNYILVLLVIVAHVYDYYSQKVQAIPGKLIQGKLTGIFWILETGWIFLLVYQVLIIFQPFTPIIAKDKSVVPETIEARENYDKMASRSLGTNFELKSVKKLIDIEQMQKIILQISKVVLVITFSSIILDFIIWQVIYSFGGGEIIFEQYLISGMSLVLLTLLVVFSNYIIPDKHENESIEE